jgi:hypothetical protein
MPQGARSALTIGVLGVLLLVAAIWGWSAATEPLPERVDTPICVSTPVGAGEKVFPQQVTVSVYNAGHRQGLAARTMQIFTDRGFAEGKSGNVITRGKVRRAVIWTDDPKSPAVRLVASRLGPKTKAVRHDGPGVGVTVVVGDGFGHLVKGSRAVVARTDTTICSPPVD